MDIASALRVFLLEKVLGVLEIEEEGEPNWSRLRVLGGHHHFRKFVTIISWSVQTTECPALFTFCEPGVHAFYKSLSRQRDTAPACVAGV